MSSGFSGGAPDFFFAGQINGRSVMNMSNPPQGSYRSTLSGNLPDPSAQILHRRSDLIGKRALVEFQQQGGGGLFLRSVKPRNYQHTSPISPLSPVSPASRPLDVSSISSSSSSSSSPDMNSRYGLQMFQQPRPQNIGLGNGIGTGIINSVNPSPNPYFSGVLVPNLMPYGAIGSEILAQKPERKMMNKLQDLEKQLLDDNDDEGGDTVSVVTNSEWSETFQNLMTPCQKPISTTPTSSSSSCSSSSASPQTTCPKQSIIEAASAIDDGKTETAVEILTRLSQVGSVRGNSEQRLAACMASALRSRVSPTEYPPPVTELYSREHTIATQMLYEVSPCFKLGFMAANLAIFEAISEQISSQKLHVVDFDIGQGCQYMHLLSALAGREGEKPSTLRITTFPDFVNGNEYKLKVIGDGLKALANKVGVGFCFNVMNLDVHDLSINALNVEADEFLAVNLAFRLFRLPDESVTTENVRDELLRRVKGLSPNVVTVVEQEMNGNTAPFLARVNEACGYYGALLESLDSTVPRDNPERARIEEGLGRKVANSVACEGSERVERCEVFGKWRARLTMAGFEPKPLSQQVAVSLLAKLNSGTRGNPGFTVKEQTGGISFGWMGRTLTVASAWR